MGGLSIRSMDSLTENVELEDLVKVNGRLRFGALPALSLAPDFSSLTEITEGIEIVSTGFVDFSGFDRVELIGGTLEVSLNGYLLSTDGAGSLREVGGMYISGNESLREFGGFASSGLVGNVVIVDNGALESVDLGGWKVSTDGRIKIVGNKRRWCTFRWTEGNGWLRMPAR